MKRILVDTSVYSQAMRGLPGAVGILRRADQLFVCPVVIGELLGGFRRGRREQSNRENLRKFLASTRVTVTTITPETAEFYAHILQALQAQGTPIPTNDIWIAACAMESGAQIATSDQHFEHVPGLICVLP